MALSGKYGKLDIPGIDEDEPVFIIRARDLFALEAIDAYWKIVERHDSDIADSLESVVDVFGSWKGNRKIPD